MHAGAALPFPAAFTIRRRDFHPLPAVADAPAPDAHRAEVAAEALLGG